MSYKKDDLIFLPLGGSNEIGMNVNLYHYQGKWLMVDLGAGFAGEEFPGIQMLAPDLSFIYDNLDNFLGIVLTHGHEDHIGSVGYLWDNLRCPIYGTPFTLGIVRNKLNEARLLADADKMIHEKEVGSRFDVGPFNIEMMGITHSVPEMQGLAIRTDKGTVFHTGDWKLDPSPVVGEVTEEARIKALGDEGVLAMVCDSTNVFNDRFSGSEGDLFDSIKELVDAQDGMVVVSTFASNVARLDTLARVAQACGRKIVLAGWSLRRISTIAKDSGYLKGIEFLSDKEVKKNKRRDLMVICTGCQGEPNAAMNKIAMGRHPEIRLTKEDTVIFSSKIIPGNEKRIFALFNYFVHLGCEVFTEKDHSVHVSGHPSREELKRMYSMVRPKIAIPVHGEALHLHEHCKLAREIADEVGIEHQVEIQNGMMVKLSQNGPKALSHVPSGYLGVDGYILHPQNGTVMNMRRRMQCDGIVFVTLVLTGDGRVAVEPSISTPGVMDEKIERDLLRALSEELIDVIDAQDDASNDSIYNVTRKTVLRVLKEEIGKRPPVEIQIARV